jgi:hypothetical protein
MSEIHEVRAELEAVVLSGFFGVDHGITGMQGPTTDDFEMVLPNMTLSGAMYQGFLAKRAEATYKTRHVVSNMRFVESGSAEVLVTYIVTAHRLNEGADAPAVTVADFVDVFVRSDAGWLHKRRNITPAFLVM